MIVHLKLRIRQAEPWSLICWVGFLHISLQSRASFIRCKLSVHVMLSCATSQFIVNLFSCLPSWYCRHARSSSATHRRAQTLASCGGRSHKRWSLSARASSRCITSKTFSERRNLCDYFRVCLWFVATHLAKKCWFMLWSKMLPCELNEPLLYIHGYSEWTCFPRVYIASLELFDRNLCQPYSHRLIQLDPVKQGKLRIVTKEIITKRNFVRKGRVERYVDQMHVASGRKESIFRFLWHVLKKTKVARNCQAVLKRMHQLRRPRTARYIKTLTKPSCQVKLSVYISLHDINFFNFCKRH